MQSGEGRSNRTGGIGSPRERNIRQETGRPLDFEALYADVFPSLFRYCTRLTGDADAAEDVAQEAFVRLLTREVEGHPTAVRVWLFRVATHLIRDRYRVSENRKRLLETYPVTPSGIPDPDATVELEEEVGGVRSALDALPERDRTMLLMREEGFSYREIGEAVDVLPSSVGTLLARAQRRFAEAYQGEGSRGA
jgi:RNA polymerase sigma-70 factor (ECF subfamily)